MSNYNIDYCLQTVDCKEFEISVYSDETDHNEAVVIIACFLALIVGILICYIVCRICLKNALLKRAKAVEDRKMNEQNMKRRIQLERKKQARLVQLQQDSSSVSSTSSSNNSSSEDEEVVDFESQEFDEEEKLIEAQLATAREEQKVREEVEEELKRSGATGITSDLKVFLPHGFKQTSSCFAHALVVNQKEIIDKELIAQDALSLSLLLHEARLEKFQCAVEVLRILLKPLKKREKLDDDTMQSILKNFDKGLEEEWSTRKKDLFVKIKNIEKEELKPNKLDKLKVETEDQLAVRKENAIKDVQAEFISESNKVIDTLCDLLKITLNDKTEMSAEEVSNLLKEMKLHMKSLEVLLAQNLMKQYSILRTLSGKRQRTAANLCAKRNKNIDVLNNSLVLMEKLVKDAGKISNSKDLDNALNQYETQRHQLNQQQISGERSRLQTLANSLSQKRDERLRELEEILDSEEREQFFGKIAPTIKKPEQFVTEYHEFQVKQRGERWKLVGTLDEEEAKAMENSLQKDVAVEATQSEKDFFDWLAQQNLMTSSDTSYLLKSFENHQRIFMDKQVANVKKTSEEATKLYNSNKENILEDVSAMKAEMRMVQEVLQSTLKKLLLQQDTLDDKSKEMIEFEFSCEIPRLHTILVSQKLVQSKVKEYKCAERIAKLQIFKDKLKLDLLEIPASKRDAQRKTQKELLVFEQNRTELENSKMEIQMQSYSAKQTDSAIRELENKMSTFIGRATAQCARRQMVLKRQNRAIEDLEKQILDKISQKKGESSSKGDVLNSGEVQKIMQQYEANKENVKMNHNSEKEQQKALLKKKIQMKQQLKEEQMKKICSSETKRLLKDNSITDEQMKKLLSDQNQQKGMMKVQRELSEEEKMEKKVMERKLNEEFQQNLEDEKRAFLAKLAALGNLSEAETKEILFNAIRENGVDEEKARTFVADFRKRYKQSKEDLEAEKRREASRRAREDVKVKGRSRSSESSSSSSSDSKSSSEN